MFLQSSPRWKWGSTQGFLWQGCSSKHKFQPPKKHRVTLNSNQKKNTFYFLIILKMQTSKKIGQKDLVFSNYIVFILFHKLICQALSVYHLLHVNLLNIILNLEYLWVLLKKVCAIKEADVNYQSLNNMKMKSYYSFMIFGRVCSWFTGFKCVMQILRNPKK